MVERLGIRRLGTRRLGTRRLGTRRLGTRRLGTRRLGIRRLGTRRLGISACFNTLWCPLTNSRPISRRHSQTVNTPSLLSLTFTFKGRCGLHCIL